MRFDFQERPAARAGAFRLSGINVTTPQPHGVRWTVNLANWITRSAAAPAQVERNALAIGTCRAVLTLGGGDGATQEIVTVDWPMAGTAFDVHTRSLRVDAIGVINQADLDGLQVPPLLGAWVTIGNGAQRKLGATLTEPTRVVADAGVNVEIVPPRARAFRIIVNGGSATLIQASSQSSNATPLTQQAEILYDLVPADGMKIGFLSSNREAWWPLAPEAATLIVTNDSGGGQSAQFRIQWLIELG
jgi:hypothetical protein